MTARQAAKTRPGASLALVLAAAALLAGPLRAQENAPSLPRPEAAQTVPGPQDRLPPAQTTRHQLALPGRNLSFAATAGALTLTEGTGRAEAEIAYVAYVLDDDAPGQRPVTFAVNGGPGAASAYLHLGVLGPWLLPMGSEAIVPSQPIDLVANPETWLDFTDLVFVDPVGTGFSRLVDPDDRLRDRYLSIDGDIEALAAFVSRWLIENGRLASPTFFVGESYGGFRGPLLAEELQTEAGIALDGMVLLSPVLDFGWWGQPDHAPLPAVSLLPSLAAAAMEERGVWSETGLAAVEAYAAGEYVTDLLRGLQDAEAVGRVVARVTELTDLDPNLVARASGRIDGDVFAREFRRDEGLLASPYDTTVTAADPSPGDPTPRAPDPVLDAMTAPLTSAILAHHAGPLDWLPEREYRLLNAGISNAWDWGSGRRQPEAVGPLARVLALDPAFRVLVAHGATDLVTPYFATELILRQLPGPLAGRVHAATYRGGHMFYTRDESRRAFRQDALALYRATAR